MPFKKELAYSALAKAYYDAKQKLDKIIDMNNLLLDTQEKLDLYNYELMKLEPNGDLK